MTLIPQMVARKVVRRFKPFTNLKNLNRAWAFSFFKFLIGYNVFGIGAERIIN